jgi:uncharacterized protein YbjT (DUF2867 family)
MRGRGRAARAGVSHFVFPSLALSERNTGVPYFEAKAAIERHIASLKLPATILRLAIFMEDLVLKQYGPPFWWGTGKRLIGADKRLYWIAVDDVGAIVANVFAAPDAYIGRAVMLAGDCRSFNEARAIFKRVTGRTPLAIPAPLWFCRRVGLVDVVPMWQWFGKNALDGDLEPARALHPRTMDMESWLKARVQHGAARTPAQ